jgi:DNA-binding transcriptional MerR regulator
MEWFKRRHAVVLARSSPSRLKYLEKMGIVVPRRTGGAQNSEVLYSWEQILEVRAIARLRQYLSFQAIRKIIQYLTDHGFEPSLRDKQLIINSGSVTWLRPTGHLSPQAIQLYGKRESQVGQLVLTPLDDKAGPGQDGRQPGLATNVIDLEDFKQKLRSSH